MHILFLKNLFDAELSLAKTEVLAFLLLRCVQCVHPVRCEAPLAVRFQQCHCAIFYSPHGGRALSPVLFFKMLTIDRSGALRLMGPRVFKDVQRCHSAGHENTSCQQHLRCSFWGYHH